MAARSDWPQLTSILTKGMAAVTAQEFAALTDKWQNEQSGGNQADIGLTREELKWLSEHKVINVASDPAVAPLEFIDRNGEISGIAGAYLDKISAKLNVNFKWIGNQNWAEGMARINSKEADIVSNIFVTPKRRKTFDFTDSFMKVTAVIFAREGSPALGSLEGLAGRKIALVSGFATIDYIKTEHPTIEIIEVTDVSEALRLVSSGAADAYIGGIPITSHIIAAEGITNIIVTGETSLTGENAIGIRNDLPLLASAIQKAMRSLTAIEKAEISSEWLSLKIENRPNYDLIIQFAGAASAIFLFFLAWIFSLRKEVRSRKAVENQLFLVQQKAEAAQKRAELALSDAEAANAAKSTFLANMSHEIRTPLNAIIGFSDAMLMGVGGVVSTPIHNEYLKDIKNSGEHLSTVINDILDLSKIEAGKWILNEKKYSPDENIKDSLKMIEPLAQEKQIQLQHDGVTSLEFFGDESAFKRIILNLLSNAVKFTKEKGNVRCLVSNENGVGVKIIITDNGIGIPADRIDHVLNPFEQHLEGAELNQEGTGLGLPLVKNLIELHGGKFILSSEVNVGTQAIIFMPPYRVLN